MSDKGSESSKDSGRNRKIAVWGIVVPAVVGLAAIVVPRLTPEKAPGQASEIHASLTVLNGATTYAKDGSGTYSPETQPTIFVALRNDGSLGVQLDDAQVVVQGAEKVEYCDPRGGEEVTPWPLGIVIPEASKAGTTLRSKGEKGYEIDNNDSGRFAVQLSVPPAPGRVPEQWAYRLDLRARDVSTQEVKSLGTAVVVLPSVWPGDFDSEKGSFPGEASYEECTTRNRGRVDGLINDLAGSVALSPDLRAVLGLD